MSEIVIDASAALAFVLPSQSTAASRSFLASHNSDSFIAPHIFTWEVANVLAHLGRRDRLLTVAFRRAMEDIKALEIDIQPPTNADEVVLIAEQAMDLGLRAFDAAYLLLAIERPAALAARDGRLLSVAKRFVPCIDLQGDNLT